MLCTCSRQISKTAHDIWPIKYTDQMSGCIDQYVMGSVALFCCLQYELPTSILPSLNLQPGTMKLASSNYLFPYVANVH